MFWFVPVPALGKEFWLGRIVGRVSSSFLRILDHSSNFGQVLSLSGLPDFGGHVTALETELSALD